MAYRFCVSARQFRLRVGWPLLSALFLLSGRLSAQNPSQQGNLVLIQPGEPEASILQKAARLTPTPRQLRWQQLELTAFFHFGINTFTNREWGTGKESPALFNPARLDARQWVKAAKDAGMKQVILTAKHHDGFCLWPSRYTKHTVAGSPWKNGKGDVVQEVADACRRYGVGFGIYLSPWDMNAPTYGTDAYNDFFVNQLTELLTNYGQVDEVWFDGANGEGPNGKKQVYDFGRWYQLIRKLQPSAVIAVMGPDVRWVGTETGYGRETEWSVVPANQLDPQRVATLSQQDLAFQPTGDMQGDDLGSRAKIREAKSLIWYPAEVDVSIRPGWFYHTAEDSQVKSPAKLLDIYFSSVGRNAVLLLNLPPNQDGLLAEADLAALRGWKALRDSTFQTNRATGATAKGLSRKALHALLDGNPNTHWSPSSGATAAAIELTLPVSQTFDVLHLGENIRMGQRIEQFTLDYWNGQNWQRATGGTTVGYKRLLRFAPVTARRVRLRIEASRLSPALSEIGLYRLPNETLGR